MDLHRTTLHGEIDETQIKRDSRGLARWTLWGQSLLTPSSVDPGPPPTADSTNWFSWDDRYYAWEIANERFHLPAGYVPPAIPLVVAQAPVILDTTAAVKANAVADRRAAGIPDGDWTSTGTPGVVVTAQTNASWITGNPADRFLVNGVLYDGTGTVVNPPQASPVLFWLAALGIGAAVLRKIQSPRR